jgi:hypothetical protein
MKKIAPVLKPKSKKTKIQKNLLIEVVGEHQKSNDKDKEL